MRPVAQTEAPYQAPLLLSKAKDLAEYVASLSSAELVASMKLSPVMAEKTYALWQEWTSTPHRQQPAIDAYLGDIYSGLQVRSFTTADRAWANEHLYILSGLYGVLRALDSIFPYRLEMGYQFPNSSFRNLYHFWKDDIATHLPADGPIVNVSAVEYTKAVFPHLKSRFIVSPRFLTRDTVSREPKFVTVHAKIARGSFAHWLVMHRISDISQLTLFDEMGYHYDPSMSTATAPVFVCESFQGLGFSVRLT